MNIGFTFDEKAFLKTDYVSYLERASSLGVGSVELALDSAIMPLDKFMEIATACASFNMAINYHIPYFISDSYSISHFRYKNRDSLQKYNEFLSAIESIYSVNKASSTIVIHGEEFASLGEKALDKTGEFLVYLLDELSDRGLPQSLSIESLRLNSVPKVGDCRSDILTLVNSIKSSRLGICLDICHDSINYFPLSAPRDTSFLSRVNYAHIHGYDLSTGRNHLPISGGYLNFLDQILLLKELKPDITLNIEQLSDFVGETYLDSLFKDIQLLRSLL